MIAISCLGAYGIEESRIAFSSSYFNSIDNSSRDILVTLAVSVLIVIACGVVIYSLFYISVIGKIREYGRLRVIGTTKKQIRKMMGKESRKLSLLSIPTGGALGCVLGYALIPKGWYWPTSILCVLGAAALTEIAVVLSVRNPVKIAASVSPIEAIRITTTDTTKELTVFLSPGVSVTQQNSPVEAMNCLQENNPLSDTFINELSANEEITEIKEVQGILASVLLPGDISAENEAVGVLSRDGVRLFEPGVQTVSKKWNNPVGDKSEPGVNR